VRLATNDRVLFGKRCTIIRSPLSLAISRLAHLLTLALAMLLTHAVHAAPPDHTLPLWTAAVPLATGLTPADIPTLDIYLPAANPTQTGVVVIPGGSYQYLAAPEGAPVAEWLRAHGIAAFVLHYRVAPYRYPAEMLDGQRGLRLVRSRAAQFGISPDHLGVWGFSAGGHLASYLITHAKNGPAVRSPDAVDALDARPNFGILAYPVISMKPGVTHHHSHDDLLGQSPTPGLEDNLSTDLHVPDDAPPAFLFATRDDPVVPVENSVLFFQAYLQHHRSVEMHLFEHGPHGVVLAQQLPGASAWPGLLAEWMTLHGWMAP
jgi:acetyl esterase/lipase